MVDDGGGDEASINFSIFSTSSIGAIWRKEIIVVLYVELLDWDISLMG
jgi:hypothetical protein